MSTTYSAGDARLSIVPDLTGFKKRLEADIARVRTKYGLTIEADTAVAATDIDRLRETQQRNPIDITVAADVTRLQTELAAVRALQESRAITVPVRIDRNAHASFDSDARALAARFAGSFKSALTANLAAAAVAAIPLGVAAIASMTGAITQLSQAALLLPGAMSAAGSSISTLALGLSGVKDAWSAINTEAGQAGATHAQIAARSASTVQALVRAQRDLGNAYRDTRRELEDLNLSLRGGEISEQQAIIAAQKARRDLADDLARGQIRDQLDYQDRLLGIAAADQSVAEAHQRNIELQQQATEANAKGIAGADRVVAAHEALTEAQARATEASTQSSAAADAAAAAMARLAPNAQAFVTTLQDLKPMFTDLRATVQNNVFAGLSDSIRTLVVSDMPILKTGLGSIGTAWNDTLKTLTGSMGSESTQGLLGKLLGNTAEAQTRMNAAIDPLVHAFGVLSVAGSQTLPHLADVFDRLATRFDTFISAADKDGRLQKWIADGETGFAHLGDTLLNIGKSMTAISQAMGGDGMLATLDRLTEKMAVFLGSGEGQTQMRAFFDDARHQLEAWKPVLEALPGLFRGLYNAAVDSANTFLPILRTIGGLLGDNPELVTAVVTAFLAWKTVRPIIDGVQTGMSLLSGAIVTVGTGFAPLKDKAKTAMDGVDAEFVKAGKQGSGMSKFAGGLSALAGVGGGGLALLTTVGIGFVTEFVRKFTSDMNDATEATKLLNDEARSLRGNLEAITNLTGAAFRTDIATRLSTPRGDGDLSKGLDGDALLAAEALGIGGKDGGDVLSAALPGGEQQYAAIMGQLRDRTRPQVQDFIRGQGINLNSDDAKNRGIDENTILDAWLGVPDALDKIRDWKQLGQNVVDLGQLGRHAQDLGADNPFFQASLLGEKLNELRAGTAGSVASAERIQRAATPQKRLRPEFAGQFPGAVVSNDTTGTAIVSTAPPDGMDLDSSTRVTQGVAPNQDKWSYILSPADAEKYTYRDGGPTPSGRGPGPTGGFMAEIHGDEWVLPKHARAAVGDEALWALTSGRSFELGGYIDPNGNPVSPGMAPGPSSVVSPAGNAPIAPAPTAGGGGLLGAFLAGMGGTLGNFVNMGASLTGATLPSNDPAAGSLSAQAGVTPSTQHGTVEGLVSSRMAQIPGLWGLVGSALSPDPVGASMQWAGQTLDWAASSGMNILGNVGSTLWSGALGMVGMQNSILSPSNIYNQALTSTVGYFTGGSGPAGTLLGMNGGIPGMSGFGGGVMPVPGQIGSQSITLGDGSTIEIPTYGTSSGLPGGGSVQSYLTAVSGLLASAGAGGGGGGGGLNVQGAQIDTINTARAIMAAFPAIREIGMWRPPDGFNEHSSGQAADVMIPNWGSPQGQALGTAIKNWALSNGQKFGVDYAIWQQKTWRANGSSEGMGNRGDPNQNHFTHVHIHTRGGGYPAGTPQQAISRASGGPVFGPGGPTGDKIPAWLSDDEHVFTAADVAAMGGHQNVAAFRAGLHRAAGGPVTTAMVPPDPRKPIPVVPPPTNPYATVMPIGSPPLPGMGPSAPGGAQQPVGGGVSGPPPAGQTDPNPGQDGQVPEQKAGDDIARAAEKLTEAGGAGMGAAPANRDHTLPALNSAILSSASNIGSWISTAVSAAAAGGTMGAGGGAAAGAVSPLITGGIQQGAKVLTGGLNVLSSLMVGNVPGSYGGADDATGYGQIVRPQQRDPVTAPTPRVQNNSFHGMDVGRVFAELDLRDAQDRQAILAGHRW